MALFRNDVNPIPSKPAPGPRTRLSQRQRLLGSANEQVCRRATLPKGQRQTPTVRTR